MATSILGKLKIDSPDVGLFRDRLEAARGLAWSLRRYDGRNPLVMGIPRGGMVMADLIARQLDGELGMALVHKLRAPDRTDLAIGSVAENGLIFLNDGWERQLPDYYLKTEAADALSRLRERRRLYGGAPRSAAGRIAILVDDGVATGATMIAALRAMQESAAKLVIAAVAVAPPDLVAALRREADDVVCLATPEPFFAVSPFFRDFREVTDAEVAELLRRSR